MKIIFELTATELANAARNGTMQAFLDNAEHDEMVMTALDEAKHQPPQQLTAQGTPPQQVFAPQQFQTQPNFPPQTMQISPAVPAPQLDYSQMTMPVQPSIQPEMPQMNMQAPPMQQPPMQQPPMQQPPMQQPPMQMAPPQQGLQPVTLDELKFKIKQFMDASRFNEIEQIFKHYGVDKISALDPQYYSSVYASIMQLPVVGQ